MVGQLLRVLVALVACRAVEGALLIRRLLVGRSSLAAPALPGNVPAWSRVLGLHPSSQAARLAARAWRRLRAREEGHGRPGGGAREAGAGHGNGIRVTGGVAAARLIVEHVARFLSHCHVLLVHQPAHHGAGRLAQVPAHIGLQPGRAGLQPGRVGLQPGRVGLQAGRVGLQAGRAGLQPGRAGLQAGRLGSQAEPREPHHLSCCAKARSDRPDENPSQ